LHFPDQVEGVDGVDGVDGVAGVDGVDGADGSGAEVLHPANIITATVANKAINTLTFFKLIYLLVHAVTYAAQNMLHRRCPLYIFRLMMSHSPIINAYCEGYNRTSDHELVFFFEADQVHAIRNNTYHNNPDCYPDYASLTSA